jgi:hypothetical protein
VRQECEKQVNNSDPKESMLTHRAKRMIKRRCVFIFFWVQVQLLGAAIAAAAVGSIAMALPIPNTSGVSLR